MMDKCSVKFCFQNKVEGDTLFCMGCRLKWKSKCNKWFGFEFQLLKNNIKSYNTSKQDVLELEDYIFDSNHLMHTVTNGLKYPNIKDEDFQTARYPEVCARCQFKKICWEDYKNESV